MSTHVDPRAVHDRSNLSRIVDALRALRKASQQSRYRNGAPPQLPSREAIAEIVENLVASLFPRHFGPSDITIDNVDGFIAYTLDATLRALREQVRRELALFDEGKEGGAAHEDWTALVVGFVVSLIVGFIAVKWLLGYIRTHRFTWFAIYRIVLGVALLALVPAGG